ncbi:MAG: ABC transporter permease, partial [Clostridia bacterium]|nr:ABC transporter permease [Clostridia bacterium]
LLSQDQDVREYAVSYTRNVSVVLDDQTIKNIKLEEGDQSKFPISYVEGTFPQKENEIALSYLNAKELGKKIGSQVLIKEENTEYAMTVTGIYSDITNGGLTAKTVSQETLRGNEILWSVICVDFHPGLDPEKKVKEYQTLCPDVKVAAIEQYIRQTLGSSILAIRKTSLLSTVLGLFLAALVVSLFMRMIIVKDRYSIVVLKGIGFTNREIQLQYMTRAVLILVISILTGTFFSNTLGEKIFGIFLETMGASKLVFVANPWISYVCYPLLLLLTVLFATLGSTYAVRQMSIADHMNE